MPSPIRTTPPDMVLETGLGQEVHVFLYPGLEAYRHALTTTWEVDVEVAYRTDGFCLGAASKGSGVVAVVLLPRDRISIPLVTHELTHAALRALARMDVTSVPINGSPDDPETVSGVEEMLCQVMEELHGGFWRQWIA